MNEWMNDDNDEETKDEIQTRLIYLSHYPAVPTQESSLTPFVNMPRPTAKQQAYTWVCNNNKTKQQTENWPASEIGNDNIAWPVTTHEKII